jgi:hypothetical protein
MSQKALATLHKRLKPLTIRRLPLAAPPPRDNRFGKPLELAGGMRCPEGNGSATHCMSVRGSSLMFGRARFVLVEL